MLLVGVNSRGGLTRGKKNRKKGVMEDRCLGDEGQEGRVGAKERGKERGKEEGKKWSGERGE